MVLVLPPLIGALWFWLRFEEMRELALERLGFLAGIAFLCFLAFLMHRRWKNRHEYSGEHVEMTEEKNSAIVIRSCEPPNPAGSAPTRLIPNL